MTDRTDQPGDIGDPEPIQLTPESTDGDGNRRGVVVGIAVLGGLILLALFAVVAYRNLVGEAFAAAGAVPPDADVVVSFDLLQVRDTERIDRLINAFSQELAEAGEIEDGSIDLVEEIDTALEGELGITLSDDIAPWIGRSVSIAAWVPDDLAGEHEVLVSVAVRNHRAAADFIEEIVGFAGAQADASIERTEYRDGNLWSVRNGDGGDLEIWLGGDLMLGSASLGTLERGLDARDGPSLLDVVSFNEVVAELPADRLLTLYLGSSLFENLTDLGSAFAGGDPLGEVPDVDAVAVGLTLRDDGIQFDLAQINAGGADVVQVAPSAGVAANLPLDTIGYAAFSLPEDLFAGYLATLEDLDEAGFNEVVSAADEVLGVDIANDLLPAFGGDVMVAVTESATGISIGDMIAPPIAIIASIGVVDQAPVATALSAIADVLVEEGLTVDGESPAVVTDGDTFSVAYALTRGALVIGAPAEDVSRYLLDDGGLDSAALYRELDSVLVGDGLVAYLDLHRAHAIAATSAGELSILEPLRAVGVGYRSDGDVVRGSLLLLIDY